MGLDAIRPAASSPSPPLHRPPPPSLPRRCHPRALAGKRRRSRMEPRKRKRGSASPSKAARCSITGSTPGANAKSTVWQGSWRSRSWSCSWSPPFSGVNHNYLDGFLKLFFND
jgi:hypothetical protein